MQDIKILSRKDVIELIREINRKEFINLNAEVQTLKNRMNDLEIVLCKLQETFINLKDFKE